MKTTVVQKQRRVGHRYTTATVQPMQQTINALYIVFRAQDNTTITGYILRVRGKVQLSEFALITYADNVGGIVGYADGTSSNKVVIDSAVNSGAVTGNNNVGGIVGGGTYASLTTSATNSGSIKGVSAVGGIVGCAGDINASNKGFSITNASNTGTVTSTGGEYVGGISGYSRDTSYSGTISNTGNISASNTERVGGVVGYLFGGTLAGTSNTQSVSGAGNVGGIVGVLEGATIDGATNNGTVTATGNNVGGVVGWVVNGATIKGSLDNSKSIKGKDNVGGIVGYNQGSVQQGSYTVKGNCKISGNSSIGGIVGYNDDTGTIGISSFDNRGTTVTGTNYVGGFIGYNGKNGLEISGYTNNSQVSGTNYVGGIVGSTDATLTIKIAIIMQPLPVTAM